MTMPQNETTTSVQDSWWFVVEKEASRAVVQGSQIVVFWRA